LPSAGKAEKASGGASPSHGSSPGIRNNRVYTASLSEVKSCVLDVPSINHWRMRGCRMYSLTTVSRALWREDDDPEICLRANLLPVEANHFAEPERAQVAKRRDGLGFLAGFRRHGLFEEITDPIHSAGEGRRGGGSETQHEGGDESFHAPTVRRPGRQVVMVP